MSIAADYSLFGWKVRSALPLSDLEPWRGAVQTPPDVTISLGPLTPQLADARPFGPALQIAPDTVQLSIPAVARYRIERGTHITIDPVCPLAAPDIRVFLYGTVSAVLSYQRNLLPMHAAAVLFGDGAVAFCGASGAGKSTLGAAMARRGLPLVSDDVGLVDFGHGGQPMLRRGFARLKLWHDVMDHFAIAPDGLERSRPALAKFHVPARTVEPAAVPLKMIFVLRPSGRRAVETRVLRGLDRIAVQDQVVYRPRLARELGKADWLFSTYSRMIDRLAMIEISRGRDLGELDRLADTVAAMAAS